MADTLFVELTGGFDFDAMVSAMTCLGTSLGGEEPWTSATAGDFCPSGRSRVTRTLTARGAELVVSCKTDRIDPRESGFLAWDFRLTAPRGAARWDGAEWADRAAIWLTLDDLAAFEGCRAALVAGYGRHGRVRDTTERPEHAAHNARVLAANGHEQAALALAQRVIATPAEQHEGAARSELEGLRLRLGGVGPDGAWLRSALDRDPGNIAAWGMKGGAEAERALGLLTPFDVGALHAGREIEPDAGGGGRPVRRGGRPIAFGAPRALRDQLFREAGASAWDVRRHTRRRGPDGVAVERSPWLGEPEPGTWKVEHSALWFGGGLRVWVQLTTNRGGTLRRIDWLSDEALERRAVFEQHTRLPEKDGDAVEHQQARVVLLPSAGAWETAVGAARLEID